MKKYIKILFSFFAIAALFMVAGCEDDDNLQVVEVGSLNPTTAYPLDMVSMDGNNLDDVRFVFVNNTQATFQLDGTTLSFQVPGNAPAGNAKVTLAMLDDYRVTANLQIIHRPIPVFERITPSAALPGEEVTIIGTSLDNLESVTVGEVEATVVSSSATELVFTVPDGLPLNLPAVIGVNTQGGSTESTSIFYVGENLLANGELEEGSGDDFTNWSKFNGATLLTATTNADEAYAGRSLRAVGFGGDAWRTQFASDAAATVVDDEYTLYMWIRAEAGTPGDGGNIRFSTTPSAMYSGNYDITSEWQQVEWVFTANEANTQIVLDLGVIADAVYYIDNVTLIATGAAGPQPIELLLNGSFEEGAGDDFTNWNKFNGADLLTQTTNGDEVRTGTRALRAVGFGGDAWRTQMASDAFETEVGVEYIASMWIKAEAGSPGDGGTVRFSTTPSALYGPDFPITTEWQKVEWTFTANVVSTQLVLDLGFDADAVYFIDDVSVLAPAPPPPGANLLLNGGFEEGDGDDLTNWTKMNGADLLTATTADEEVRNGSRALRAVGFGGDAWRTQLGSDAFETEVGANYIASMWIKAEAGSPGDGGTVRFSTAPSALYGPDFTITTEWQKVEWTFTANVAATQLILDLGFVENAVYFIDNVEVVAE